MSTAAAEPRRHTGVIIAWIAAAVLAAASVIAASLAGWGAEEWVSTYTISNLVVGLALAASGLFIAWFRPRHMVGLLLSAGGFGHLVSAAIAPIGWIGLEAGWPEWVTRTLMTVYLCAWTLGLPSLFALALVYFPDGRLPSPRWRWAAWYIVLVTVGGTVSTAIGPFEVLPGVPGSMSILAVPGLSTETLDAVGGLVSSAVVPLTLASLVVRFVRGDARTRRQLMWLILAVLIILVVNLQRFVTGDGPIVLLLSTVVVPIAIAIAIVREGLLDIRVVLSRTLVYGSAITVVIALYAGLVAGLALIVPADADRAVAVVAAVVVALVFNPLLLLARRAIGRLFFGTRDDPVTTAERVGAGIGVHTLDDVLRELRTTLRMPRLAVMVDGREVAADGDEAESAGHATMPLRSGTEPGSHKELVITLRPGESRLHESDSRTLALLAPAIALVLREQRLVADLRLARAQTAEARETERKTLHRDLHDGLGPTLTGAALHIDAARNLINGAPTQAKEVLAQARGDVGEALAEVRRVVYGLRPLALDGHGLVGALREVAARAAGLPVELEVGELPDLSPGIELATYRVAVEGIANANRHSTGSRVTVALTAHDGTLEISVRDNGTPPASYQPGVGIRSLIDRVEELRGTVTIGPVADGWSVVARLPLRA